MAEVLLAVILGAIAVGEVPRFHFNRATLALVGAVLVVAMGILPLDKAFGAIDWNTLALLFAMMVFTAHLRLAGFFAMAGRFLARTAGSPRGFLLVLIGASALLSALFINDTVVLLLTPLVCELTLAEGLNPLPFLVGLAVSSNIGSMASPVGNPQNILIATTSGLGFGDFAGALAVPAVASLGLAYGLLCFVYRKDLDRRPLTVPVPRSSRKNQVHPALLVKCAVGFGVMVLGFVLGWSLALSALGGAAVLLVTRRIKPAKVLRKIDGTLLLFFAGLFVITKAVEGTGGFQSLLGWSKPLVSENIGLFTGVTAGLSNLISNVPAVMVLKPLIPVMPVPHQAWMALAAASTLAGNLTLLGSVANLIVAETARPYGVRMGFVEYLKTGLPLALGSLALTAWWLATMVR